jgi:hypothetical protein
MKNDNFSLEKWNFHFFKNTNKKKDKKKIILLQTLFLFFTFFLKKKYKIKNKKIRSLSSIFSKWLMMDHKHPF